MYEHYQKLLDEKGLKNADVSRATGISNMTLSDWKHGKTKPKTETMQKLADYLNVSVDYLVNGKEADINSEFSSEQAELDVKISQDIELKKALKKYFSLSDEKKKHIIEMIKLLSDGE